MFYVLLLSSLSLLFPYYLVAGLFSCLVVVVEFDKKRMRKQNNSKKEHGRGGGNPLPMSDKQDKNKNTPNDLLLSLLLWSAP